MTKESQRRAKKSDRDIDISARGSQPKLDWRINTVLWVTILAIFLFIYYLDFPLWTILAVVPVIIVAIGGWLAWFIVVKRGAFTWMRLAQKPAKLMAAGDADGAERVCREALERARQFGAEDHRRGLMLCELAMFVKNQGRQAEAVELYEECVAIFAKDVGKDPLDYFVALNNYGICFIHVKDYDAAQRILEKAVDMILAARKREANQVIKMALAQVQALEFVLHLNLAFLFMEMRELHESELQLRDADVLAPLLSKKLMEQWIDHYAAICAMWEFRAGNFAQAEKEIARRANPTIRHAYGRERLHMVRMEFAEAEDLLRKHQLAEKKRGVLHRPEMLTAIIDLAEALFGGGKQEEAFTAFAEARSLVAEYAIPGDADWGKTLELWLKRARESNRRELAESIEKEISTIAMMPSKAITVLDKFKVHPPTS